MVNALKLMEKANCQVLTTNSDELGIDYELFKSIASRCGFLVQEKKEEVHKKFRLKKKGIPLVQLYSREQGNTFNFLDVSDFHVGNKDFNPDKLHEILQKAVEREVRQVFIAGDIFEAVYDITQYDFRIMNLKSKSRLRSVSRASFIRFLRFFESTISTTMQ